MRTDADLAGAFRGGDDQAFAILYERYKRAIYVFGRRMLGEPDAARDLVQDVFLRACEQRGQLHRPERFRSWIFAIARNRCLTLLRAERGRIPFEEAPAAAIAVAAPADRREGEEDALLVRRALMAMRVEDREVLLLREYLDMSYREISEVTGWTESAVKSRLFKARRALHGALRSAFAGRSAS